MNLKVVGQVQGIEMKIPKSHFNRFKKKFIELRNVLNLRCYHIYFRFEPINDAYAKLSIDQQGGSATISFSSEEKSKIYLAERPSPEQLAKHEVSHLFIAKLGYLAYKRFIDEDELDIEEEKLVRILEQIL